MTESLTDLNGILDQIFAYGSFWVYAMIFIACFVENIVPPFPGDTFILAAGGLVALQRLDLTTTVAVVLTGGMSSVMILYYIGRHYGREFVIRKNYRWFTVDDVTRMEQRLENYGGLILVSSRFILGLRSALAIAAGIAHYYPMRMFFYSLLSYIIFTGLLVTLAIKLVENFSLIEQYVRTYNIIVWPIVGLLIGLFVWRRIKRYRTRK
ncbi:MAG: DedA family protein [bacterium]|nr:DedA family protein [bacterium]